MVRQITPSQALECYLEGEVVLLDVRTLPEWRAGHIPNALHIPLDEMTARYQELDPDVETLVICQHGVRSEAVAAWLAQMGFENVANVRQGMSAWDGPVETGEGKPVMDQHSV